jgi:xanthine dehydrogenase/oxidase
VSILLDGTVTISHGGIEMGQGINTKVAQAAAMSLGINLDQIVIQSTSTSIVPNVSPTGGSITSELCVKATLKACDILNDRLAPFRSQGNPTWEQLVQAALMAGVDLNAKGYVFPPNSPNGPQQYSSTGACCAEVLVDVLTGELEILKTDILFDCGVSMNPAIDIGQVEGGFIQGMGMHLTEDLLIDNDTGRIVSNGTWEYKPPCSLDIPIEFNVTLLKNSGNPLGILRSKAVGEPPLCMACCVLFAIQNAVSSARSDANTTGYFDFNSPSTVDVIQQACLVNIKQMTLS